MNENVLEKYIVGSRSQVMASRTKQARKRDNISTYEMAEALDITTGDYLAIEKYDRLPSVAIVIKICILLDVRPHILMGFDQLQDPPTIHGVGGITPEGLSPDQLQNLLQREEEHLIDLVTLNHIPPKDLLVEILDMIVSLCRFFYARL